MESPEHSHDHASAELFIPSWVIWSAVAVTVGYVVYRLVRTTTVVVGVVEVASDASPSVSEVL